MLVHIQDHDLCGICGNCFFWESFQSEIDKVLNYFKEYGIIYNQ